MLEAQQAWKWSSSKHESNLSLIDCRKYFCSLLESKDYEQSAYRASNFSEKVSEDQLQTMLKSTNHKRNGHN